MWLQASRIDARTDSAGAAVLLERQDRRRFDQFAIRRGTEAIGRALSDGPPGPYTLQAAIAACHARATSVPDTDWATIVSLYDALAQLTRSPIMLLNRAVAHSMYYGPEVGLRLVDDLTAALGLRDHHLLPSVRAELLARLERHAEARQEFRRAAALATNSRERDLLLGRAERNPERDGTDSIRNAAGNPGDRSASAERPRSRGPSAASSPRIGNGSP